MWELEKLEVQNVQEKLVGTVVEKSRAFVEKTSSTIQALRRLIDLCRRMTWSLDRQAES
jgi:hypothetical protein